MLRTRTVLCFLPLLAFSVGCSGPVAEADSKLLQPDEATKTPAPNGARGWGLEVGPTPRELVYLEVTPAAAREIKALAADMKLERWWLRYRLVPGGCTGFQNKLDLDAQLTDQDFEYVADGIPCVVSKSQRHLAQGTRIDFITKDGKTGFVVTNPHASARTKEALAKWITDEFSKRNPDIALPVEEK